MHILVPCKGIAAGKSRLRDCLEAREHRALCEHLLVGTLDTAVRTAGPGNVWILTADDDAASIAWQYRVRQITDACLGLNPDLEFARRRLLSDLTDDAEILVLPIDLPFVQPATLEELADCDDDVVIAPDERGTGTNALLMRPDAARSLPFDYGRDSFAAHVSAARKLNLSIRTVEHWRLAFDIDEPAQYFRWARSPTSLAVSENGPACAADGRYLSENALPNSLSRPNKPI